MNEIKVLRNKSIRDQLKWDGDNSWFLVDFVIPNLKLSDDDKRVMRWAYENGWEEKSDGETGVKDMFLGGVIKDPAGVVHDYINRVQNHTTPDGHKWTARESNALYRRIKKALGAGFRLRWRRWIGLTLSSWKWWK
jgi:hypothetical protein